MAEARPHHVFMPPVILTNLALWIIQLPEQPPYRTEADTVFLVPFQPDPDYLEKTGSSSIVNNSSEFLGFARVGMAALPFMNRALDF